MQFQEKPRPPAANDPTPAEREDVHVAANRCPFCHDDVQATALDGVVCAQCLTRHHDACWKEAAKCSSCGHAQQFGRLPESKAGRALPTGLLGKAIMVAVLAVTLLVTVGVRRAAQERERAIAAETAANTERQLREAQAAAEAARAKALALSVEAERLAARDLARRQAERELSDRRRWAAETAAIEAENTRKAAAERKYQRELERSRAESQVRTRSTLIAKVTKERQLLKARATDLRRRLDLAEGFFESGDFASCMAEAAKIIALDASEPEGWILRARAHLALNERDAAVGAYERALDCPLGPDRRKVVLEALDALEAYRPIDDYAE